MGVRRCIDCEGRISILAGSIFRSGNMQRCKLSVRSLTMILLGHLNSDKAVRIAQAAGCSEDSVTRYTSKIRQAIADLADRDQQVVGAPGFLVESDKTSHASECCSIYGAPHLRYYRWLGLSPRGTHKVVLAPLPVLDQPFKQKPGTRPTMSVGGLPSPRTPCLGPHRHPLSP